MYKTISSHAFTTMAALTKNKPFVLLPIVWINGDRLNIMLRWASQNLLYINVDGMLRKVYAHEFGCLYYRAVELNYLTTFDILANGYYLANAKR